MGEVFRRNLQAITVIVSGNEQLSDSVDSTDAGTIPLGLPGIDLADAHPCSWRIVSKDVLTFSSR